MKTTYINICTISALLLTSFSVTSQTNITENKDIASLIAKKRIYNKKNGTGFRIQLYNGSETTARRIKSNFQSDFRGVFTKLEYEAPDWKVQVGSYKTKLDADRALNIIREKYSGGIIISK